MSILNIWPKNISLIIWQLINQFGIINSSRFSIYHISLYNRNFIFRWITLNCFQLKVINQLLIIYTYIYIYNSFFKQREKYIGILNHFWTPHCSMIWNRNSYVIQVERVFFRNRFQDRNDTDYLLSIRVKPLSHRYHILQHTTIFYSTQSQVMN